jgi:integrase
MTTNTSKRGMGTVYRRGRIWWIKFYRHRKPIRESSGSEDRQEAMNLLKQRLGEAVTGKYLGVTSARLRMEGLFAMVIDDYERSEQRDIYIVRKRITVHLLPAFGGVRAAAFTSDHIARYISDRRMQEAANATINRELAIIRRGFNLAARMDPPKVARVPHIACLPEENVRQGFIEWEAYERLRDELGRGRLPFVIGYHLGNRKGEILRLEWPMVDLDNREIRIPGTHTKSKKPRTLPIYGEMEQCLLAAKEERDRLFPKCRWVCSDAGERIRCFKTQWKEATKRAGFDGLLFHDLRRSAIRNMERAGIPRSVAMAISGHKTESIYRRYDIVSPRDIRAAGNALEQAMGTEKDKRQKKVLAFAAAAGRTGTI